MPASHNQIVLDQKTQRRNKEHDVGRFLCYDGDNVVVMRKGENNSKKKSFAVRCWTGLGLIIYAGNGHMEVRGYSECMDISAIQDLDSVVKMAYRFINPEEE
jgi:hypothetical protein